MSGPVGALKTGLASFFKSEEFSDLTIICGPYYFKVHKVIVCSQSEYFRTACQAGRFKEGATGVIELQAADETAAADDACDEPEIVKLMIEYFYHCDYNVKPVDDDVQQAIQKELALSVPEEPSESYIPPSRRKKNKKALEWDDDDYLPIPAKVGAPSHVVSARPAGNSEDMSLHAKVFALAVKYHVTALRDLATEKFRLAASSNWNSDGFAPAAHIVFTSTADDVRQLRDIVVETIRTHIDLLDNEAVGTVVRSINELAYEVLMKTARAGKEKSVPSVSPCCRLSLINRSCNWCGAYGRMCQDGCRGTCNSCGGRC